MSASGHTVHHSRTSHAASAAAMGDIHCSLSRSWRAACSLFRSWGPRRALSVLCGHIHAMSPILSAARAAGVRVGAAVWGGRGVHKWPESGHLSRVFLKSSVGTRGLTCISWCTRTRVHKSTSYVSVGSTVYGVYCTQKYGVRVLYTKRVSRIFFHVPVSEERGFNSIPR